MRIKPRLRTARKSHFCDDYHNHHPIRRGEQYWRLVLAPWEDVNTSDSFWTLKMCVEHYVPEDRTR